MTTFEARLGELQPGQLCICSEKLDMVKGL